MDSRWGWGLGVEERESDKEARLGSGAGAGVGIVKLMLTSTDVAAAWKNASSADEEVMECESESFSSAACLLDSKSTNIVSMDFPSVSIGEGGEISNEGIIMQLDSSVFTSSDIGIGGFASRCVSSETGTGEISSV